jgi:hypothetical protein
MADQTKKYGFKDLRTAAELALAPGKPLSRSAPAVSGLKFDGKLGAVVGAASLSSAAFSSIRASLNAKKSLASLQTSITSSLQGFDTQRAALTSGQTALKDVAVFGLASAATVQAGGFFSAADLTQISSVSPGTLIAGSAQVAALLTQRRKNLSNLTTRISIALSGFSIASALIQENYNRTPYPLPEEVDAPSTPRLAQGDEAAKADPILKDKRKFTVKGAVAAAGKPSFWARLTTSVTDPLRGYRLQPGFNAALNMVFADKKQQKAWSEPSTPYAAQFPYNKVTQTESGHVIEYDDTPGAERVHIFHRSGSFIEMHPDGKVVYKSMGHGFLISMADQNIKVKGTCNISVDGEANIYAKGQMNLQSDSDINVNTKKDFNVYATNVNLRAKKNAKLDGLKIDLRYATLPGVPVFTMNGPAVRLNPAALKQDFPEIYAEMRQQDKLWTNTMNRIEKEITKSGQVQHLKDAFNASYSVFAGPYTVSNLTPVVEHLSQATKATLSMLRMMRSGQYPSADVRDVRDTANVIFLAAPAEHPGMAPEFVFPPLEPDQMPVDNPLANPLAYIAQTPAAVNYRTLLLDTPEEMGDAEQYQAHLDTRQLLGDIPSVEPQLGGKKSAPDSGIAAPASLPLVNYLDRDTYRGNFSADPSHNLGGTSFTYGELVDSLARPDVANPDVPVENV